LATSSIVSPHELPRSSSIELFASDDTEPAHNHTSHATNLSATETEGNDISSGASARKESPDTEQYPDDAQESHSLPPLVGHIQQTPWMSTDSRVYRSAPVLSLLHSPPPSPGTTSLPLDLRPSESQSPDYALADTPPPSRRASLPAVLVRETPPKSDGGDITSVPHDAQISNVSIVDPRYSDPFVGAPYLKPPVFIDYGTTLKIAPSTFVNRNFTVMDSPASSFSIGERCLIGPNVTLAGVGHPLGTCLCFFNPSLHA
jgi:hypothetical protein